MIRLTLHSAIAAIAIAVSALPAAIQKTSAADVFYVTMSDNTVRKFDTDGTYVRRYIPELKNLDTRYLHAPWEAPEIVLRGAGVHLGVTYPRPIVDLAEGRARALAAFQALRA